MNEKTALLLLASTLLGPLGCGAPDAPDEDQRAPGLASAPLKPAKPKCEQGSSSGSDRETLFAAIFEGCTYGRNLDVSTVTFTSVAGGGVSATYTCCPPSPVAPPPPARCTEETVADLDHCSTTAALRALAEAQCRQEGRVLAGEVKSGDTCAKGGSTWGTAMCCMP
jgi:hypothetical protein